VNVPLKVLGLSPLRKDGVVCQRAVPPPFQTNLPVPTMTPAKVVTLPPPVSMVNVCGPISRSPVKG